MNDVKRGILESLGIVRAVVVTHKSSLSTVLAAHAVANITATRARSCLVKLSPLHEEAFYEILRRRGVASDLDVVESLEEVRGRPAVVHAVGVELKPSSRKIRELGGALRVILTHSAGRIGVILGVPVVRVAGPDARGLYRALLPSGIIEYYAISLDSVSAVSERPDALLERGRKVLLDAMVEFGQLTLKDAVNVLAARLGATREEARVLFYRMVEQGLFKVKKGQVMLA
ncbi:MAG: hypothetical protein QXU97_02175 [Fervidicoccaceae archaeon]